MAERMTDAQRAAKDQEVGDLIDAGKITEAKECLRLKYEYTERAIGYYITRHIKRRRARILKEVKKGGLGLLADSIHALDQIDGPDVPVKVRLSIAKERGRLVTAITQRIHASGHEVPTTKEGVIALLLDNAVSVLQGKISESASNASTLAASNALRSGQMPEDGAGEEAREPITDVDASLAEISAHVLGQLDRWSGE